MGRTLAQMRIVKSRPERSRRRTSFLVRILLARFSGQEESTVSVESDVRDALGDFTVVELQPLIDLLPGISLGHTARLFRQMSARTSLCNYGEPLRGRPL